MAIVDINEFLAKVQSNEVATVSKANLRNERLQEKSKGGYYKTFKKEAGKNYKLLIPTEIAIPFNPFTMKEDDTYNSFDKFRLNFSQTTTMLTLKAFYDKEENAEVKSKFMKFAGVEQWDTSDIENVTAEDRKMFSRYRVIRTFSERVAKVTSKVITGQVFGCDYRIKDLEVDETGAVVGELPDALKIGKFSTEVAFERYTAWKEQNEAENDKTKKDKLLEFLGDMIVSDWNVANFYLAIKIDLNKKSSVEDGLANLTEDDIRKSLVVVRRNSAIMTRLQQYIDGSLDSKDKYADFYEMDVVCPAGKEGAELGNATTYDPPLNALADMAGCGQFLNIVSGVIDGEAEKLEEKVRASCGLRNLDDTILKAIKEEVKNNYPVEDQKEFLTDVIVKKWGDVITDIYGESADCLITEEILGELPESKTNDAELMATINKLRVDGVDDLDGSGEFEEVTLED